MKGSLRSVFFWFHLTLGVIAGTVILVMSATGVLLAFEAQITEWAERGVRSTAPAPNAPRLSAETLLARAGAARPGATISSLTLAADPGAPAAVGLGRGRTLFLDAHSGRDLGEGSRAVRAFFREVTDWHRFLGAKDESRPKGRAVTGAANLAFLGLVVSGLFLWLPRVWSRSRLRDALWFRRGLSPKARDYNWHHVLGFWSWLPLLFIVGTGVVMSYPWANALLFRAAGEAPPRQGAGGGPGEARPGAGGRRGGEAARPAVTLAGLDPLWAAAERRLPGWQTISLRLPETADEPLTFTLAGGPRGRPDLRAQLTLDRATGAERRFEPFAAQGRGRRWRSWGRFLHTGEAGGLLGQSLAAAASAGAVVLVWTGLALAWRRLRRRLAMRRPTVDALAGETVEDIR